MIDPQPGHRSGPDKIDNQLVRGVEHFRQFHPDRCQIVYVEKAAIINFFGCDAPECEAIRLRVEQLVQTIEAARITRPSVNLLERLFNRALDLRRFLTTPLQTAFYYFF